MSTTENFRLHELAAIADMNKGMYEDFEDFLKGEKYKSVHSFIISRGCKKPVSTILKYLIRELPEGISLYDGIAKPYRQSKAKWLFLGWLLRDAPEQRLRPMISEQAGKNGHEQKAKLLNAVRMGLKHSHPEPEHWTWFTTREVFIDRLEGSRRAIKGTLYEIMVRDILTQKIIEKKLSLDISGQEVRIEGETYDVCISGKSGKVLMPVKTRETMGGGHAQLFTRDIHKSISVAGKAGRKCVPVVIAESWGGDLDSLDTETIIRIKKNPNQIDKVKPILKKALENLLPFLTKHCQ